MNAGQPAGINLEHGPRGRDAAGVVGGKTVQTAWPCMLSSGHDIPTIKQADGRGNPVKGLETSDGRKQTATKAPYVADNTAAGQMPQKDQ